VWGVKALEEEVGVAAGGAEKGIYF